MKRTILAIVFLLGSTGCSYLSPLSLSMTSINPDDEVPIGIVRGSAINGYFLGIPAGVDEGMDTALQRAKDQAGADNLINVSVDRRITFYPFTLLPLYVRIETTVTGTAIRYRDPAWAHLKELRRAGAPATRRGTNPTTPPPSPLKSDSIF